MTPVEPGPPAGTAPARAQGSVLLYFALTFALAWACFVPLAAGALPAQSFAGGALLLLGTFSPSLVALALTARARGAAGVRALLSGVGKWEVAARWYVFAATYIAVVKLVVAVLHRVVTGDWPRFGTLPLWLIPFAIAVSTPFQAGEEVGWRGYALPRMAARMGLGAASVLLGVLWAVWHLPLFFVKAGDTYGQSFILFVLQVTALSVALAWLWARTRGSLLLAMLLHAAVNNSKDIVPSATPGATNPFTLSASLVGWMTVALLWLGAAGFLATMPRAGTFDEAERGP